MHRTEGLNNDGGLYTEGPPPTTITAAAMNALQEEIASVIEYSGQSILTAGTDTHNQLLAAVLLLSLSVAQAMRIGDIIFCTTEDEFDTYVDEGALPLNGQTYDPDDYPLLAVKHPTWISGGVLTVPDWENRVPRVKGEDTGDINSEQQDQGQGWQAAGTIAAVNYFGAVGSPNTIVGSGGVFAGESILYFNTSQQGVSSMITAFNDGTNGTPRTGSETRGKAIIVGVVVIADSFYE